MYTDIIKKELCTGCMACKNICPKNAINIYRDKNGFEYPSIDTKLCVRCGLCRKICPVIDKMQENGYQTKVYVGINKDEKTRLQSSSGGIFSVLANYILSKQGIIYGTKFNQKLEVSHERLENKKDIELFRGSKYVQSKIRDTYKKVKEDLKDKKLVLFTGTPCQVEGLLSFLGKKYDNLYTQDIICHGVPSPKVWKKYVEYKKEKNGEYPLTVNFRKKDILGWSNYQVDYKYSNKEEIIHHKDDIYMKIFLNNLDLRESCYNCQFKKISKQSDITLGDFWGIDKIKPRLNDEKGVSVIIINSLKGEKLFNEIKQYIKYDDAKIDDVIKYNSCVCQSTQYNLKRDKFFEDIDKYDFEHIIYEYFSNEKKTKD